MKMNFTHPYREDVSINFGPFTQIVGDNQQLKYYMWQLLIWYFNGKKYNVEDLNLFEQIEPEITGEDALFKRTDYKIISISDIQDLIEQMAYKKGTVAFDFLKSKLDNLEIMEQIDYINDKLDQISMIVNERLDFQIEGIHYHTESQYFTTEQLILKNFLPYFGFEDKNIAFEFVENETKFIIFMQMLKQLVQDQTNHILLVLRNMDDYLNYSSFVKCCEQLQRMTDDYSNFNVIIFPSNEGYLYLNRENMEYVNIVSDLVEHFYEFSFMYERFIGQYPTNDIPTEDDFIVSLQKISPYLFSEDVTHMSLSIQDMVTLKIMNSLYHYNKKIHFVYNPPTQLLINFLKN